MTTPRYQKPSVTRASDQLTAGSSELTWYNAIPLYEPGFYEGKSPRDYRSSRHGTLSLNHFQRFTDTIYCAVRVDDELNQRSMTICSEEGSILNFFIGGGTEIPHFGLRLRLATKDTENPIHVCVLIWTAWNYDEFEDRRRPTQTPHDGQMFTFSSTLANASLKKVQLTEKSAKACMGIAGGTGYKICWTSFTPPHMRAGLDIPSSKRPSLFSEKQLSAFGKFEAISKARLDFSVITRVRRPSLEESWNGMTSMPSPTLPPYPFYECNYVHGDDLFQAIKQIPPTDDPTIKKHHQRRTWGWQNKRYGGFEDEENLYCQLPSPYTFIVDEREYEALRMIAIIRERDFATKMGNQQWNGHYSFDIFPASDIHKVGGQDFQQYFYGMIEGSPRAKGPAATLEDFEQNTPTPDPGTLLTFDPKKSASSKDDIWEGVVVSSQGILESLGDRKPLNAIFVRLKRPVSHLQGGLALKLSGYVSFASPTPGLVQARRAIRYAMWGNDPFRVPRTNRIKQLLFARDNSTVRFHRKDIPTEQCSVKFIETVTRERRLNEKQIEALQSAFSSGDTWQNFLTLISGPPGTGKTAVSLEIVLHCLENKWPLLIVCGSNHGLDVLANRVAAHLAADKLPTKGIYRLGTESLEAFGMEMPSAFRSCEDEEDQTEDQTGLPQTSRLEKDLRERGILSDALRRLVVASVEEMVVPNRALALTERILAALRSLLSGDKTSRTSSKINDCLWKFVTCQELLRRHSSLSAQSTAVISTSRLCGPDNTFESVRALTNQLKTLWLTLQELYLNDARIVFCTASTSSRKVLRGFQPHYLIIEEASQLVESQSLNPIMRNYSSLKKIILSGDAAQLPPTVLSSGSNECFNLEQVSFFERMIKTGHPDIQLNIQYRMAPDISEHVSQAFYGSNLITDPSCVARPNAQLFAQNIARMFDRKLRPGSSFFLSVDNTSLWRRKGDTSFINPEYVDQICFVVKKLCKAGVKEEDILLLSFYLEERRALSHLIHNICGLKSIVIKSVDASQGSESAFVILSTTRPGSEGGLGFVQNMNRQCVALSRAQDGLLIVGHENMGKGKKGVGYETWNNLVRSHASGGRLVKVVGQSAKVMRVMGISEEKWETVN
ncbi:unnamed protein product [Penicillium salamii]|uniref:P-loop containing nucleoside triphosphate hydrolase protein n=1 Tax=Penicillium salamii TaxID=1612424 RepID=A0A9W4JC08_9EURO|nr:unnamed protein product [Penicillium salamii]CAG7983646.1 unnamed protein product [Penicillium salamii]CAG8019429.1 unnamed protein product [Penicillium salamii]CAG8028777.1 unnamed protein product [Penicillium salamii]CAG8076752.1 unnamed protein product [Penicillium salamii]